MRCGVFGRLLFIRLSSRLNKARTYYMSYVSVFIARVEAMFLLRLRANCSTSGEQISS